MVACESMQKDFDSWNTIKKKTNDLGSPRVRVGDIHWCAMGLNVGRECDGKGANYRRPVVILRKYSNDMVFVLPLTTNIHSGDWYFDINIKNIKNQVVLAQGKTMDTKRLSKKLGELSVNKMRQIMDAYVTLLQKNDKK